MKEHETTIEVIRKDYMQQVNRNLGDNFTLYAKEYDYDWQGLLENCTTLQLRSLAQILQRSPSPKILRCNPEDHLVVTFCNMYVGIEPDGYTHS